MSEIRPYECTACHGSFKTESGMLSHVSRQHTGPQLNDTLGRHYSQKLESLQSENERLRHELEKSQATLEKVLIKTANDITLIAGSEEVAMEALAELRKAYRDQETLTLAVVLRERNIDELLKEALPKIHET